MAISIAKPSTYPISRTLVADITLDTSYPTGGYTLRPSDLGMGSISALVPLPSSGLVFEYDSALQKLLARYPSGGANASPAALAAPVATATGANAVVPVGATAVTSSAAQPALTMTQPTVALTPGQGKEVANATNLSTVTVRVIVFGS